jgi:hypothetical protein
MATRSGDGAASSVERWLSGLSGPALTDVPPPNYENPSAASADHVCPVCNTRHNTADERDTYDEDFDYYWGSWRLPLWIALIWQVPWRQRLDIFVAGFIVGMVIAGFGLLWGFVLSQF